MTARGWSLLAARCAALPAVLAGAVTTALPPLPPRAALLGRWVVTGTGASEGPARVLVSLLQRVAGRCAEFVPLSSFAGGTASGDVLVVVSQGLSPNARLALGARGRFGETVLVTAALTAPEVLSLAAEGVRVAGHPPENESGVLLRVQGPAAATVLVCRLADAVAEAMGVGPTGIAASLAAVPDAVTDAGRRADLALQKVPTARLLGEMALVTTGEGGAWAHGLRWKWLEGVGLTDPPVWDVLQVAHGPYQHFVEAELTLVALERPDDPASGPLLDRLAAMLDPRRHCLVRLRAAVPGVGAALDHDAQCNHLVLRALEAHPRDLVDWPGRGRDEALYGLGR